MNVTFKIRRKSDGKFSTGGVEPTFTKLGKAWATKQQLRSHLTRVSDYPRSTHVSSYPGYGVKTKKEADENRRKNLLDRYRDCEVVEFEVVEANTMRVDLYEDMRREETT